MDTVDFISKSPFVFLLDESKAYQGKSNALLYYFDQVFMFDL